jgi:Rps23 Pro-64 3,4-dihydroxylase Tpa1-like proline 4-hydroxylase
MEIDRKYLANLILVRLTNSKESLTQEFNQSGRINTCIIENLFPSDVATKIYNGYPSPEEMTTYKTLRENKRVAAQMDLYNPILEEAVFAFQDERVVDLISQITGLNEMIPDKDLYAGGISLMAKGNFLNPHLDNSHDNERENYRVLNLLYYCTPAWEIESGGNLELWDNGMNKKQRIVHSKFNRLVLMITNKTSIHSVSKVVSDGKRCCVSNYYFSNKPAELEEYFHVTSFYGRPEEPIKKIVLRLDAVIRQSIRLIFRNRLVKTKHIYKKK